MRRLKTSATIYEKTKFLYLKLNKYTREIEFFTGLKDETTVAITYRVHDFENFDENFVQGTISPLLKSHIPLDGSVSLFKYLPTKLKRI